jgi:hypothetical protein
MKSEFIDATPNTVNTFHMLLAIVKNGKASDAKWAEAELIRYAKWVDDEIQSRKAAAA